jgi:hypothetical protein
MASNQPGKQGVDLEEVSRLVAALERDLEEARTGAGDLETLRKEVADLRAALDAPAPAHREVNEGLQGIRALLQKAEDELFADADYVARIGRMLGM